MRRFIRGFDASAKPCIVSSHDTSDGSEAVGGERIEAKQSDDTDPDDSSFRTGLGAGSAFEFEAHWLHLRPRSCLR
jgi:hypothetical protein